MCMHSKQFAAHSEIIYLVMRDVCMRLRTSGASFSEEKQQIHINFMFQLVTNICDGNGT